MKRVHVKSRANARVCARACASPRGNHSQHADASAPVRLWRTLAGGATERAACRGSRAGRATSARRRSRRTRAHGQTPVREPTAITLAVPVDGRARAACLSLRRRADGLAALPHLLFAFIARARARARSLRSRCGGAASLFTQRCISIIDVVDKQRYHHLCAFEKVICP